MGVLIKDMEIPESCYECNFHQYHETGEYVCVATPLLYPMNLANYKGGRKDFCPLIGVPTPHGDLVDRDKLMTDLMDSDLDHLQRDDWKEVIQIVQDAPTLIEAEGSET